MFYFCETKYLYEYKDNKMIPGIKGFLKIVIRNRECKIKIHMDIENCQDDILKLSIFEMESKKKKIIIQKDFQMNGKELNESFLVGEELKKENTTIGCEIIYHNNVYTENQLYDLDTETVGLEASRLNDETWEQENTQQKEDIWKEVYITNMKEISKRYEKWQKYENNSFLMHGYYNYRHIIVSENLLGVPGNYYDKEKQVAAMFGFTDFLTTNSLKHYFENGQLLSEDKVGMGTFGYYVCYDTVNQPHE